MHKEIDCIIVGYYDPPFEGNLDKAKASEDFSGLYRHLLANSILFKGKRGYYFDVLNRALKYSTGLNPNLHFARMPSLASAYLASYLKKRSFSVEIINYFNAEKEIFTELLYESPKSIAISTTYYTSYEPIQELVAFIREHNSEVKIIVGGPYIYHLYQEYTRNAVTPILEIIDADIFVIDAQGEQTLSRICQEMLQSQPNLRSVPNLVFKMGKSSFVWTRRQPEENALDSNPINWRDFNSDLIGKTVPIRTARGCAFKCSFCRYHIMNKSHTLASINTIEEELRQLNSMGVKTVLFIDDTFNVPQKRFKDICRMVIRNRFDFNWFSYFRCANADEESFDLMAQANCIGVFLGIESADPMILKNMNKGVDVNRYRQGIQLLNERDIMTLASFVVGFPGETESSINRTIDFIIETKPMFYSVQPYFHDPKVPITDRADEFGFNGQKYSWHHNTMDWQEATRWTEKIYKSIKHSIILPCNGFDIWSIAYLLNENFTETEIVDFLRLAEQLLIVGLNAPELDSSELEEKLLDIVSDLNFVKVPENAASF